MQNHKIIFLLAFLLLSNCDNSTKRKTLINHESETNNLVHDSITNIEPDTKDTSYILKDITFIKDKIDSVFEFNDNSIIETIPIKLKKRTFAEKFTNYGLINLYKYQSLTIIEYNSTKNAISSFEQYNDSIDYYNIKINELNRMKEGTSIDEVDDNDNYFENYNKLFFKLLDFVPKCGCSIILYQNYILFRYRRCSMSKLIHNKYEESLIDILYRKQKPKFDYFKRY